jgi:hypothetical protein
MASPDITERPVFDLGLPASSSATWRNSDYQYDYAIGGIPFLAAINDKSVYNRALYRRSFVQIRKDQVDQQTTPGEQSLSGWWLRSQSNFTGGAGIKFVEPASDERTMRRFKDSLGVDCWTTGQISLLNATTNGSSQTGRMFPVSYGASSVAYIYGSASPVISRAGVTAALTGTGTLLSVADDGTNFFRLTTTGLYKGTIASGGDSAYYTTTPATGTLAWAKGRLMAGLGVSIYELTGSGAPTLPAALYTHPNTAWVWSSICDGPAAIYAAGSAGSKSAIYKFALDSNMSSGSLPALTRGTVAAELPTGEIINFISTYLGRYMAVCTNKGVRVAIIDGNGDLTYGPLIWTDAACYSAWGGDRFFYVGTTISSGAGLIRIDLSDPDTDGRFPYATDLQSSVASAYVTGVCQIGTGVLKAMVAYTGSSSTPVEEGTSKVSSGWLRSGQVRYSTLEPKHFELVKPHWEAPLAGSFSVSTIASDGGETSLLTVTSSFAEQDIQVASTAATVSQGVRFDLYRDGTTPTTGPTIRGWQLKAVPAVTRKQMLEIPLLVFDFQRDRFDAQGGYEGFAFDRLNSLLNLVRTGDVVTFQDLSNNESLQVVVEDYQFEQVAPPGIASGFGGILTVQLREI